MFNLFHKNSSNPTQSSLPVTNPILLNAAQMNNEFLNHNKLQHVNQQGVLLQPTLLAQAPIAPTFQSAMPLQSSSLRPSGLTYRRGGPYRQIRLRTHSWGNRSENGWSGFNNWKYLPQNLASWEPKNFVLGELRSQSTMSRGLNLQQAPAPLAFTAPIVAPVASFPIATPLAAPLAQPVLYSGKQSRGHHHGLRKKRAQAVLPVQPIGGGPAIATIAQTPILAAPLAAPVASFPIATRAAPLATPVETIIRPTIIQETIRTDRVIEVQPVVHRQIEQPIIHHIEKHITEAPAASLGGIVRLAPVVQQNTSTRIIDEITPIVHREVAIRQVDRVEEHLSEHVVVPTRHTNSVLYDAAPIVAPIAPVVAPLVAPVVAPISAAPISPAFVAPIHQTLNMAPIVEETVRTDRVVEIQPIVHREVEQNVINHIEKHITEVPAPLLGGTVRMSPIVQESINTRVIDEIQPVVHREVAIAQVERVEEHLVERVVAPTQHTNTIVTEAAPLASSPLLLQKQQQASLVQPATTYGSAMM